MLNEDYLDIELPHKKPEKGDLLLSKPVMGDEHFWQSVILLVENNEEGAVGFVLNKPLDIDAAYLVGGKRAKDTFDVNLGGPVENDHLYYIHTVGSRLEGSIEIYPGLWWGGNVESLVEQIDNGGITNRDIKFFIGYSGWGKEQLQEEVEQGYWLVAEANRYKPFLESDDLWRDILRSYGNKYKVWVNFPDSIMSN